MPINILSKARVIGAPLELHWMAKGVVVQMIKTAVNDSGIAKLEKENPSIFIFRDNMVIVSNWSIIVGFGFGWYSLNLA